MNTSLSFAGNLATIPGSCVRCGCCRATRTVTSAPHTATYAAALKTKTHPKTQCRKPYAATQHLMLLMMGVCTRNMSRYQYINKITFLHQVGISNCFESIYFQLLHKVSFYAPALCRLQMVAETCKSVKLTLCGS